MDKAKLERQLKKATKLPIARCREALALAEYDADLALDILEGRAPALAEAMSKLLPKSVKGWTRRLAFSRADEHSIVVAAVRTKKLTSEEKREKKQLHYNGENVGDVEDRTLCWLWQGTWHRVLEPRWELGRFSLHDGRLVLPVSEGASTRVIVMASPDEIAEEIHVPATLVGMRVGSAGFVATAHVHGVWVRPWEGEWRELPAPEGVSSDRPYACSAEGAFWVSFGPRLYRWHEDAWHQTTARGTTGYLGFSWVVQHGAELVARQGGEIWRGDADLLRPISLMAEPRAMWFEGPVLVIEDSAQGRLMRFRGDEPEGAPLDMPEDKGKRAVVKCPGPHGLAVAGARMWQRASNGWREIATVPLWEAAGTTQLRWETDPHACWLPPPPGSPRPATPPRAPASSAPPSIHDTVSAMLDGSKSPEAVADAVKAGANLEELGRGATALYRAARAGRTDVLAALVKAGADIDGLSIDGLNKDARPALVIALEKGHKLTIVWLLSHGALPSFPPHGVVGGTERSTVSPLAYAAWLGDLWAVKKMLARDHDLESTMLDHTALARAIDGGHDDVVELLMEHGAPIRARHERAASPVRMLLRKSLQQLERFEADLRDDLAGAGGLDALESMFVDHKNGDKQQEIDWLLERGARPTTSRAFEWAIDAQQLRAVELALEAGLEPDLSETLSFVMRRDPIPFEVIRMLLAHGADPDVGDHGALYWAVRADDEAVAALLLEGGAEPARKHYDVDNLRADPLTALEHATRKGKPKTTALLSGS